MIKLEVYQYNWKNYQLGLPANFKRNHCKYHITNIIVLNKK